MKLIDLGVGDLLAIANLLMNVHKNFEKFLLAPYWSWNKEQFHKMYDAIKKTQVFKYDSLLAWLIDFADKNGTTGYYSKITFADGYTIKAILINKCLWFKNNRLIKQDETHYTVEIALIQKKEESFQENSMAIKLDYG